jgi:hypothetical protein
LFLNNQLQSPLKPSSEKKLQYHCTTNWVQILLFENICTWNSYASTWKVTESRFSHLRWFPRQTSWIGFSWAANKNIVYFLSCQRLPEFETSHKYLGPLYIRRSGPIFNPNQAFLLVQKLKLAPRTSH